MAGARNSTNATPATIAPRWSAETEFGPINRPLTSDGRIVAVAGEGGMTGLDARTGATAWRLAANGLVTDATVTDFGPVLVHQDGLDGRIVALDWKGDILWSEPGRGAMGVDAIRGCGDRLLSAGEIKDPARRLVFRVHDAATGKVVGTYPGEATLPYLSRFGLVYAVHSSDPAQAGLFLQPLDDMPRVRLLDLSHSVLDVRGDLAVLDTTEGPWEPSALVAYDLAARRELWREAGGQVLRFGIGEEFAAAARFVDVTTGTIAVRRRDTGALIWETEALEMRDLTIQLLGDLLVAEIDSESLHVYELASGRKLSELPNESSLTYGPCLTPAGLYDAYNAEVRCLWRAGA